MFYGLYFTLFFHFPYGLHGAKILFVSAPGVVSHMKSMIPLAQKLDSSRKHEIYFFMESPLGENLTIKDFNNAKMIAWPVKMHDDYGKDLLDFRRQLFWGQPLYKPQHMLNAWRRFMSVTEMMLKENFTEFKGQILGQKFDLVVSDSLTVTGLAIAAITGSLLTVFHPSVPFNVDVVRRSIPDAWSYTPSMFMPGMTYDHKSFWDRTSTVWTNLMDVLVSSYADHKYVKPRFDRYSKNVSLYSLATMSEYFLYSHTEILDYSKPRTIDTIPMGGACDFEPSNLNPKLRTFIEDSSSKGTIIMAFGHYIDWEHAPNSTTTHILSILERFRDYRIILQGDHSKIRLANLWSAKWLPQQALLQHPKTKLFVNHGGMKTITEATCAGVPQIVVPFFYDQNRNGHMVEKSGSGRTFHKSNLIDGRKNLGDLMQSILINDTFEERCARIKNFLNDRILQPLDYGRFWVEFFLRHEERKRFRLKATFMTWMEKYMVDIFGLLSLTTFIICYSIYCCIRKFDLCHKN